MSALRAIARAVLPRRTADRLRDALWRALDVRGALRSGLPLEVRGLSDWVVFRDIFVNGEYDEAIDHALASAAGGEPVNILDVGANVGFFALRCLDLARRRDIPWSALRLTLVEGSPHVCAELVRRTAMWGAAARALTVRPGLAGLIEGSARMEEAGLNCMNRVAPAPSEAKAAIPYLDLRPELQSTVHLLKCDIEGSELDFLESYAAHLGAVRAVVIELHHDRCDTARCVRILEAAGFRAKRLLRDEATFTVALFRR